jgi:hypothetical protein
MRLAGFEDERVTRDDGRGPALVPNGARTGNDVMELPLRAITTMLVIT